MAATRLRKTFHYPTESDDEDAVEQGMDEQDQSNLISTLSAHDTSSTRIYTLLLSLFPLVPALLHIPLLLNISTFLPNLLAITSFLASAYTLYFLPLPPQKVGVMNANELKSGVGQKKKIRGYGLNTGGEGAMKAERRPVPGLSEEVTEVLAKYIVPANTGVCMMLVVLEFFSGHEWSESLTIGGGFLPGFILGVVLWARMELRVVDLGELEKLRFTSLKGM